MELFLEWSNILLSTFGGLSNSFLFAPSGLPGFENVSLAGLVLGGGLIGLLSFKALKFIIGIVTGS